MTAPSLPEPRVVVLEAPGWPSIDGLLYEVRGEELRVPYLGGQLVLRPTGQIRRIIDTVDIEIWSLGGELSLPDG